MIESVEVAIWQQQQDFMAASFNVMRTNQVLTDVTIVCDGTELPAHRSLLSAASPFFQAMFKSECKESLTGKMELPSIPLDAAKMVLDFIYTGKIPSVSSDRDKFKCLLEASHLLQLNLLFQYCLQQLTDCLSVTYFIELWELAVLFDDAELQLKIPSFIAENFFEVSCSKDFFNMTFSQLNQVLQNQHIKGCATDIILKGVIAWAKFNAKDRSCIGELLKFINIKLASARLLKMYAQDPLIENNLLASNVIDDEITERFEVNCCVPKILCFGFDDFEGDLGGEVIADNADKRYVMTTYYVNNMTWSLPVPVPTELKINGSEAVVAFNEDVYFLGGKNNDEIPSATVYKYSPVANKAIRLSDLKVSVTLPGAEALDSCIYVVGGEIQGDAVKTVQCIDTFKGTTELLSSTNVAHFNPIVFDFQNYVYAVGSFNSDEGALEKYDPVADQWTVISEIPGAIRNCRGGLMGDNLFIFPFCDRTDDVGPLIYDLVSGKWEVECKEGGPTSVRSMFVTSARRFLAVDNDNVVHIYNILDGKWYKHKRCNRNLLNLSVFLK